MTIDLSQLSDAQAEWISQFTQMLTKVPSLHEELLSCRLDDSEDGLLGFIAEEFKLSSEKDASRG